jgi:hypothetical protein
MEGKLNSSNCVIARWLQQHIDHKLTTVQKKLPPSSSTMGKLTIPAMLIHRIRLRPSPRLVKSLKKDVTLAVIATQGGEPEERC